MTLPREVRDLVEGEVATHRMPGCVFCRIIDGDPDGQVLRDYLGAVVIEPRDPVVPGHLLIVPKVHAADVGRTPPLVLANEGLWNTIATEAALHEQCNVITSRGPAATQTIMHTHVHIVPRAEDDGLALPWTGQHR